MKTLIVIAMVFSGLMFSSPTVAQVNVNVNIGLQPVWGPVGYDYVEYYYFPDYDFYYHVPSRRYVVLERNRWVFVSVLPHYYPVVNYYSAYKVVLNHPKPYMYHKNHKHQYARYKGHKHGQMVIAKSNDPRYHVVKGHPNYKPGRPAAVHNRNASVDYRSQSSSRQGSEARNAKPSSGNEARKSSPVYKAPAGKGKPSEASPAKAPGKKKPAGGQAAKGQQGKKGR
jgi:hypothetical protein